MGKMLSNKQIRRKAWGLASRSFPKLLAASLIVALPVVLLIAIPAVCIYFDQETIGFIAAVPIVIFLPVLEVGSLKILNNLWRGRRAQIFRSLFCFTPKVLRIWGIMLLTELIMIGVVLPWFIAMGAVFVRYLHAIPEGALTALQAAAANLETVTGAMGTDTVAIMNAETALVDSIMTIITANPACIAAMFGLLVLMMVVVIYMSFRLSLALPALVLNPGRRAGQCIRLSMRASKRNVWRIFCNGFMLALPVFVASLLIGLLEIPLASVENGIIVAVVSVITWLIEMLFSFYVMLGEFGLARQLLRSHTAKRKALLQP